MSQKKAKVRRRADQRQKAKKSLYSGMQHGANDATAPHEKSVASYIGKNIPSIIAIITLALVGFQIRQSDEQWEAGASSFSLVVIPRISQSMNVQDDRIDWKSVQARYVLTNVGRLGVDIVAARSVSPDGKVLDVEWCAEPPIRVEPGEGFPIILTSGRVAGDELAALPVGTVEVTLATGQRFAVQESNVDEDTEEDVYTAYDAKVQDLLIECLDVSDELIEDSEE